MRSINIFTFVIFYFLILIWLNFLIFLFFVRFLSIYWMSWFFVFLLLLSLLFLSNLIKIFLLITPSLWRSWKNMETLTWYILFQKLKFTFWLICFPSTFSCSGRIKRTFSSCDSSVIKSKLFISTLFYIYFLWYIFILTKYLKSEIHLR